MPEPVGRRVDWRCEDSSAGGQTKLDGDWLDRAGVREEEDGPRRVRFSVAHGVDLPYEREIDVVVVQHKQLFVL